MKPMSPKGRALLDAYRDVSEVEDQPDPELLGRLQFELAEETKAAEPPRRAAAWLVASFAVASGVTAVLAWPRPEVRTVHSAAPVSAAIDEARTVLPKRPRPRAAPPTPSVSPQPVPPPLLEPAVEEATPRRPSKPATTPPNDDLVRELALLRQARLAMREEALDRAAAALREHGSDFPSGQLAEDRDALWVIVRCHKDAKNTGRAAFEAAHPSSHHLVAIRAACEKK